MGVILYQLYIYVIYSYVFILKSQEFDNDSFPDGTSDLPISRKNGNSTLTFHRNLCLFRIFDLFFLSNPLKRGKNELITVYNPEVLTL